MPQVMKPEVLDPGFLQRGLPYAVGHFPANRLPTVGKAVVSVLPDLSFRDGNPITV
jgi:hypothetical protein